MHSFTGTREEMWELVNAGWDIGVNGCSMKTVENLDVVREIPLGRLQVETDGPWCEIRNSHASMEFLVGMGVGVGGKAKVEKGKANGKAKGGKSEVVDEVEVEGRKEGEEEEEKETNPVPEKEDETGELKEWKSVKKERWAEGLMIKGRNEPCMIGHVAWAIAGVKGISVKQVAEAAWANSVRMFGVGEEIKG